MQSQLHDMALWAIARRLSRPTTLTELQTSFDRGDFARTHVLRPTWHFVDPADIHWLQSLTASRVERLMDGSNRTIGLTAQAIRRGVDVIVATLADGQPRTRAELGTLVAAADVPVAGQALAHVMMQAEIDALVVNGPVRGKQHTYRLLAHRPVTESRDELLARLARRYARGHGPIRDKDLAWWSSLTLLDSRRAIDLGELRPIEVGGQSHWTLDEPIDADPPLVMLLSNYDEYISYTRDPDDFAHLDGAAADIMRGAGLLMVRGRLAGTWTRTVAARRVDITVTATPRVTVALRRGIEREAAAFGRFVDREAVLTFAA